MAVALAPTTRRLRGRRQRQSRELHRVVVGHAVDDDCLSCQGRRLPAKGQKSAIGALATSGLYLLGSTVALGRE